VTISKIKVTPDKKNFKIAVNGKIDHLPTGAKVEFRLTLRSQALQTFTYTVSGGLLRAEFTAKDVPVTSEQFTFITVVEQEDQPGKVKGKMAQKPKIFPPALNPWTEYHPGHRFQVADPAAIATEITYVREFFLTRIKALSSLRKEILAKVEAVEAGEEFVKDDAFQAKAWRKWFDTQAVAKIRTIQKDVEDAWTSKRFQPYKRACYSMRELSACIAVIALAESKKLYKSAQLKLDPKDTDPEIYKLRTETRTRMPTSIRELKRLGTSVRSALPAEASPPSGDSGKKKG